MTEEEIKEETVDTSAENITIFDPRGVSDYLRTYPELKNIPEFMNITIAELKFCWWFANPTSPLVRGVYNNKMRYDKDTNPKNRANHAYSKVWTIDPKEKDEARFNNYVALRFPEPIKLAIEIMSKLDYTARYRAKKIADSIFTKYESLSELAPDSFKDEKGLVDYVKYANVLKLVSSAMSDLIRIKEHGFGVVDKAKKKGETENDAVFNEFLEEQV